MPSVDNRVSCTIMATHTLTMRRRRFGRYPAGCPMHNNDYTLFTDNYLIHDLHNYEKQSFTLHVVVRLEVWIWSLALWRVGSQFPNGTFAGQMCSRGWGLRRGGSTTYY